MAPVPPPSEAIPGQTMTHTHTKDVKAEALCDRLADQLVREAVEAHVAPKGEAPRLWLCILPTEKRSKAVSPLGNRGHVGRGQTPVTPPHLNSQQISVHCVSAPELQLQKELPERKPSAPQDAQFHPREGLSRPPPLCLGWQAMPGPGVSSSTEGARIHLP